MARTRFISLFFMCAIAVPVFALTPVPRRGDRIGVLRMPDQYAYGAEQTVANTVQNNLRRELREIGFDAFDARITYDAMMRSGPGNADFYVEVVSADAAGRPMGSVGVGTGDLGVEVAVVVARVAAEVRLYDARTLNLLGRYDLQKKSTAVVPTGIGIGGRSVWASIFLPFVHYGQYRAAARDVAHQAAIRIAGQ